MNLSWRKRNVGIKGKKLANFVPAATIKCPNRLTIFVLNSNSNLLGVKEAPSAPCVGNLSVSKIQQGL